MTKNLIFRLAVFFLFSALAASVAEAVENPGILWNEDRIAAIGQGVAPEGVSRASAKLLARRAAVADLQRNVLEFLEGARVQARTTVKDFVARDVVESSVQGLVRHVAIRKATWDGEIYAVEGSLALDGLRQVLAPRIGGLTERPLPIYRDGYRSLVVDVADLPFAPALVVVICSESGRKIYGPGFIDRQVFLERGLCRYAKAPSLSTALPVFASPAWADDAKALSIRAKGLSAEGEIVIADDDADLIEKNAFDFRIPGDVTILTKTAALRGLLPSPFFARRALLR